MKVFVSYALPDREWVHGFASCLRAAGAEVSSWGSSFHLAGDTDVLLERRMAAVDFVVLVLSDGFMACNHVLNELGMAKLIGKPITSVMIEPEADGLDWLTTSAAQAVQRVQEYAASGVLAG